MLRKQILIEEWMDEYIKLISSRMQESEAEVIRVFNSIAIFVQLARSSFSTVICFLKKSRRSCGAKPENSYPNQLVENMGGNGSEKVVILLKGSESSDKSSDYLQQIRFCRFIQDTCKLSV